MSLTMKLWEGVVGARLRTEVSICEKQYGSMAKKEYHMQYLLWEEQRRSEGAALCLCRPWESTWQGAKRGAVVLDEGVWSSREVCSSGSPFVSTGSNTCLVFLPATLVPLGWLKGLQPSYMFQNLQRIRDPFVTSCFDSIHFNSTLFVYLLFVYYNANCL